MSRGCAALDAAIAAHFVSRRGFARAVGAANDYPRALIEGQYKPGRANATKIQQLTGDACTCDDKAHTVHVELWDAPVRRSNRRRRAAAA